MAATTSTPQPLTALPSPEQLKGQVFVILGGSAGMGKAVARSALARGADVVLVSRTESKLAAAKDELVSQGADEARISTAAVDGSDEEAMKTLFAGYEKGSIHHLVATVSCWSLAKDTQRVHEVSALFTAYTYAGWRFKWRWQVSRSLI